MAETISGGVAQAQRIVCWRSVLESNVWINMYLQDTLFWSDDAKNARKSFVRSICIGHGRRVESDQAPSNPSYCVFGNILIVRKLSQKSQTSCNSSVIV